jgi:UDP-glucose 4-epimerase
MLKILVTGGAGFIGSSLIKKLKTLYDESIKIISLDNYSSGSPKNHTTGVLYINSNTWDILNIIELKDFKPDYVFHFGEFSRIPQSFDEPNKVFKSNTFGTQQVIQYCINKDCKLIYSGSSAIFNNDYNATPYTWTKAKNIELIKNYQEWFNLKYSICYFYNVYGPGQITEGSYATVIGIFEKQYLENKPLTVVRPGTQTRCFTHIDDIVNGIIAVAVLGSGDGYHLGCKDEISVIDVTEMFDTNYVFVKERRGERTRSSYIENNKAETELNWKADRKLSDYIKNFKNKHLKDK